MSIHVAKSAGFCFGVNRAVELVEHNIEIFRQNTLPGEAVTVTRGNALDLTGFESDSYDVVLLLGPLYHLYTPADKRRALEEAIRELEADQLILDTLGDHVAQNYLEGKKKEWEEYRTRVSSWEREKYIINY